MNSIYGDIDKSITNWDDYQVTYKDLEPLLEGTTTEASARTCVNIIIHKRLKLFMERIMTEQFRIFINDTKDIWDNMNTGQILQVNHDTVVNGHSIHYNSISMFEYPYYVCYFGKQEGIEGPIYVFFNKTMDKVYEEYFPV